MKDGKSFNFSSHIDRMTQKSDTGTLTFLKPVVEDEGEYFCFAENENGIARTKPITLKRAFLEGFKNSSIETMEANEGESFKLECEAPDGYPKPSIFWMIQSTQGAIKGIDGNPRVTLDSDGNLWFSTITREEATKDSFYVCSVSSSAFNEYKLGNRVSLQKVIPSGPKHFQPPTLQFVSQPTISALRGKTIEIFCIFDGKPSPKIAWSKGGKPIENNERVFTENYGKSLKIKRADVGDEGKYACDVASENGENHSSSFNVSVESPPNFVIEPESKNVTVNETFEIKCEAEGVPKPKIEWIFNGKPIEQSRHSINGSSIIFRDAKTNDLGNLACLASNQHGIIYKNIYLIVRETE
jgi:neuronal cell adhesion molecule